MKIQAQQRLPVFIALSLAIHLVWFISYKNWSLYPPQQDSRLLAVHIKESQLPGPAQKKAARSKKNSHQQSTVPAKQKDESSSHTNEQATQANAQEFNHIARAKILGHIKQEIAHYFVYPRLARRQGWQGQVMLGFQVNRNGSIQDIHVKQSSGYAILDDSAMIAMQRVGQISLDAFGLVHQTWQLEIPVIYRFEG